MAQAVEPKDIIVYVDENGNEPYTEWFESLRDDKARQRVVDRVIRLGDGLYGDCEPVGEGVSELRMFFGPGYRIYFGENEGNIVILLCGGDKSSQKRDIKTAKQYWKEYKNGRN